jgi:hypothetical protein
MKTERAWDEAERLEIMKNVQIQRGGLDWWEVWKTAQNNLETLWNDKRKVKDPKDDR